MEIKRGPCSQPELPDLGPMCDGMREFPIPGRPERLRLLSTSFSEQVDDVLWYTEKRLQIIEEFAQDPKGAGTSGYDRMDANERLYRARETGDWEAADRAIVDLLRAGMWEWWANFPERQLLTNLYDRTARRKEGCGTAYSRRRPEKEEGPRVAKWLLAEVHETGRVDPVVDSRAVTEALIRHWKFHTGECQNCLLEEFIKQSDNSRAYFDGLMHLVVLIKYHGAELPVQLFFWWQGYAVGRLRRPPLPPLPAHRTFHSGVFVRDGQIQLTIELLRRVGVRPRGGAVSGCRIVAKAVGLEEDTVIRIWNQRIWEGPLETVMRRRHKAIAERIGLTYDAEAASRMPLTFHSVPLQVEKRPVTPRPGFQTASASSRLDECNRPSDGDDCVTHMGDCLCDLYQHMVLLDPFLAN